MKDMRKEVIPGRRYSESAEGGIRRFVIPRKRNTQISEKELYWECEVVGSPIEMTALPDATLRDPTLWREESE